MLLHFVCFFSNTLKDTFDAFDKDGSGEMGYPEYVESWKFLNRPGTEQDIKSSFDAIGNENLS